MRHIREGIKSTTVGARECARMRMAVAAADILIVGLVYWTWHSFKSYRTVVAWAVNTGA